MGRRMSVIPVAKMTPKPTETAMGLKDQKGVNVKFLRSRKSDSENSKGREKEICKRGRTGCCEFLKHDIVSRDESQRADDNQLFFRC